MNLPNDPRAALLEIARYINQMELPDDRMIPQGDKRACTGWWLTIDYLYGLQKIAAEAERLAVKNQ